MNETIFLALTDIYEGCIDPRKDVFDGAKIDIANLIATLGHYKFIDSVVGEHGGDAQVLGDDDLLGHRRDTGSRSPAGGRSGIIGDLTGRCEGGA